MLRDGVRAILGGAAASFLFEVLTYTHWKNIGVKALGPAIDLIEKWEPNCFAKTYLRPEDFDCEPTYLVIGDLDCARRQEVDGSLDQPAQNPGDCYLSHEYRTSIPD